MAKSNIYIYVLKRIKLPYLYFNINKYISKITFPATQWNKQFTVFI